MDNLNVKSGTGLSSSCEREVEQRREPVYKIDGLTKIYKNGNVLANDNISLEINRGEIFGIFGPNGAGKTTLVRQLAGLIKPTSGSIYLNGADVIKSPDIIPRHVAYFAQAPWILWSLKVWETIYFTGIFRGLSKKDAKEQTDQLITKLDLTDIRDRLMERVSGGQAKLLGIAAALIGQRQVMILDEPTNELDPTNRIKVWNLFTDLCREKKVTIILVTHNVLEAEQVVDRVIIVDKGKIIANGTPGELKSHIDDRVRLEFTFKPNTPEDQLATVRSFENAIQLKPGKWQVFIPKQEVPSIYNGIMKTIDIENLEDFRLMTTTLEDVYLRMGGKETGEFHD
ncbi:MAG: ABC transporter ATP-binding protein [bacterium]|nr:ABC transporter ATP-binding protein [bacterium]